MKPTLTNRTLAYITNQIINGRPLWGLLWANEYLDSSDPIHKALVLRARVNGAHVSELFKSIAAGKLKRELNQDELTELGAERLHESRIRKPIIVPRRAFNRAAQMRAVG